MQNLPVAQNVAVAQYASDEIDLVELAAMLWRLRFAAAGGAAVGVLVGFVFLSLFTADYETTVPITIARSSLPANVDSKRVVEMYTSALGSPELVALAFSSLEQSSPEFAANMKKDKISVGDLVIAQTALENLKKPDSALIKLGGSGSVSDFFVTVKLPVKGLGSKAREAVLAALNAVGSAYNQREMQNYAVQTTGVFVEASKNVSDLLTKQETALVAAFASQVRVKAELAEIEYGLQRNVGVDGVSFARLPHSSPTAVVVSSTGGTDSRADAKASIDAATSSSRATVTAADFERVVRLKAILVHSKRMSAKESAELDTRIARLQMKVQRMRAELEPLVASMESSRDLVARAQRAATIPLEKSAAFVPLFAYDSVVTAIEAQDVKAEKRTTSRILPVLGGGFLGAMLGFFGMIVYKFVRKNRRRIADIISKEA